LKKYYTLVIVATLFVSLPLWAQTGEEVQIPKEEVQTPKGVQSEKVGDDYIIGPGDLLTISLWRDDALNKEVTVLADGKISFPLVGEVMAAGKTVAELKKEMAEKLTEYVPEPVLSIEVKQPNSMVIYVTGRVNSPNRYPINSNVSVMQALSTAGGLNPFAKKNKIKIFRQEGDKTTVFHFKYDEVVDGKNIEQNISLKRGDVIVVP
jgi:polysaccharide export outer membrane protein